MKSEKNILKSALFVAGVSTTAALGATEAQTNSLNSLEFTNLGTGGQFRTTVSDMNSNSSMVANAREAIKYAELSCGESTCGSKEKKKEKAKTTKTKKAESKSTEAKCGEATCGAEKKEKSEKKSKKSEGKATEAKCGEATCGGKEKKES
ncbi:MAG: hypothetical protein MI922_17960 [Bacteroidales bacterium]|nr:hypothetical protein [Bacteroidales bacterium]